MEFLPVLRRLDLEPILIRLNLDYTEMRVRLQARRCCPACGAIYSLLHRPPRLSGNCDECGGPLVERHDDQVAFLEKRIEQYLTWTVPVADFLQANSVRLVECSAMEPPADVLNAVLTGIVADQSLIDLR